jgi:hypothetical protein
MNTDSPDQTAVEEALICAGVFHPEDLESNEAGYLSEAQKRWMVLEAALYLGVAGLEISLMVAMLVLYLHHPFRTLLLIALFWGIILTIGVVVCIQDARPILEELRDGRVDAITGSLSKHFTRMSGILLLNWKSVHYGIRVRDRFFSISATTYDAIADHQIYRLFCTTRNKTLVNIEPLNAANEKRRSALASLQHRAYK